MYSVEITCSVDIALAMGIAFCRPSDSVQKILGNYAEFPGGHIMWQKRSIMCQIMRFLLRRFHIEHVLLNSLKLACYVYYFVYVFF